MPKLDLKISSFQSPPRVRPPSPTVVRKPPPVHSAVPKAPPPRAVPRPAPLPKRESMQSTPTLPQRPERKIVKLKVSSNKIRKLEQIVRSAPKARVKDSSASSSSSSHRPAPAPPPMRFSTGATSSASTPTPAPAPAPAPSTPAPGLPRKPSGFKLTFKKKPPQG
jgi:hypothetical protein